MSNSWGGNVDKRILELVITALIGLAIGSITGFVYFTMYPHTLSKKNEQKNQLQDKENVAIQATSQTKNKTTSGAKTLSSQAEQTKYMQEFLKIAEEFSHMHESDGTTYELKLNDALQAYNNMYQHSTHHPFMFTQEEVKKIQDAKQPLSTVLLKRKNSKNSSVKVQALSSHVKEESSSHDQQVKPLLDKFIEATEEISKNKDTEEKYANAVSHARKEYIKIYNLSTKHPFVISKELQDKITPARKHLKDEFLILQELLLKNLSTAMQKLNATTKNNKEYKDLFDDAKNKHTRIVTLGPVNATFDQENQMKKYKQELTDIHNEIYNAKPQAATSQNKSPKSSITQPVKKTSTQPTKDAAPVKPQTSKIKK